MRYENQYLTGHYRSQTLHLINKYQILKASRSKEESGPLLQLHCTGELWLIIIITKMSNLIQVAEIRNEQNLTTPKSTSQTQIQCPCTVYVLKHSHFNSVHVIDQHFIINNVHNLRNLKVPFQSLHVYIVHDEHVPGSF